MITRAFKTAVIFCLLLSLNRCGKNRKENDIVRNGNQTVVSLQIDLKNIVHPVSPMLFGLFLEDINFSVDGGLNANMVNNYSFDGVYLEKGGAMVSIKSFLFKKPLKPVHGRLRYWNATGGGKVESLNERPLAKNSFYARISANGACRIENLGYTGGKDNKDKCAMGIFENGAYDFHAYFRNHDFQGRVTVYAADDGGHAVTDGLVIPVSGDGWKKQSLVLKGMKTTNGKLVIEFIGKGAVDVDFVNFSNRDHWGKGDPKWSQGRLRKDLVESLKDLNPKFVRFPGGCIVEGALPGNEYQWKNTVGPLIDRKPDFNLWGAGIRDGGYCQSYQIGFYEYFLLCEDLGAEPLPIVWAGLNCQVRSKACIKKDDPRFNDQVVQNAIDLIEYANGDPGTNAWAALRAAAGHPKSFHLKYIGIGNENFGIEYLENFEAVKKEIDKRYPGMVCVLSTGIMMDSDHFKLAWSEAGKKYPDVRMDEHFYNMPNWLYAHTDRYDAYDRKGPKVFLGEYAANRPFIMPATPNCLETALAEAAFLTGIERNSDVVVMSSYAPLFSLSGGEQWAHNMINFNPHHVLRTANYFVQQMVAAHTGDRVVGIRGQIPPGCYASATADDRHLYIKLVNSTDRVQRIQIDLLNIAASSVKAELIRGEPKEKNELAFAGTPDYRIRPVEKEIGIHANQVDVSLDRHSFHVLTAGIR